MFEKRPSIRGGESIGPNLQRGWDIFSRTGLFQSPTGKHLRLVFGRIGTKLCSTRVVPRHVCWIFISHTLPLALFAVYTRSIHIDHDVICMCTRLFLKWRNAQLDAMGSRANLWIFFPQFVTVGPTTKEARRFEISSSKNQNIEQMGQHSSHHMVWFWGLYWVSIKSTTNLEYDKHLWRAFRLDPHAGPDSTMVKGRDHEIVRALETHLKAIPWRIKIEFCVVMRLQVEFQHIGDQTLNQMLFPLASYSCGSPPHNKF